MMTGGCHDYTSGYERFLELEYLLGGGPLLRKPAWLKWILDLDFRLIDLLLCSRICITYFMCHGCTSQCRNIKKHDLRFCQQIPTLLRQCGNNRSKIFFFVIFYNKQHNILYELDEPKTDQLQYRAGLCRIQWPIRCLWFFVMYTHVCFHTGDTWE